MKYVFCIEVKSFFQDASGIDYQMADMGCPPILISSFRRAVQRMESIRKQRVDMFGESLVKNYAANELPEGYCYDRVEFTCPLTKCRTIVSLYKVYVS